MGTPFLSSLEDMPHFVEFYVTLRNIFANYEFGLSAILFRRYTNVYIVYRKYPDKDMPGSRVFPIKNSVNNLFLVLFFRTISISLDIQFTYV
jgi:hypothetical protein